MIDPPQPNQGGQIDFGRSGRGTKIENYTVGQTIEHLNAFVLEKYNEEKEKAKTAGKSEADSETKARAEAYRMFQFKAVNAWQDVEEGPGADDGKLEDSVSHNTFSQPEGNVRPQGLWLEYP